MRLFPGRGFTIPSFKHSLKARMSATALTCRFLLRLCRYQKATSCAGGCLLVSSSALFPSIHGFGHHPIPFTMITPVHTASDPPSNLTIKRTRHYNPPLNLHFFELYHAMIHAHGSGTVQPLSRRHHRRFFIGQFFIAVGGCEKALSCFITSLVNIILWGL
jgi:hypothetical protein